MRKHAQYFMGQQTSQIYTDHMPLMFFMDSLYLEGIYARWASELQMLNIEIVYVKGERNKVADALSRTLFPDEDCLEVRHIKDRGSIQDGIWVWKDGKGGYKALLDAMTPVLASQEEERQKAADQLIQGTKRIPSSRLATIWKWNDGPGGYRDLLQLPPKIISNLASTTPERNVKYLEWYGDVYQTLLKGRFDTKDRLKMKQTLNRTQSFRLVDGISQHYRHGVWRRCITREEVSDVLYRVHNEGGHFSPAIMLERLNRSVYWPAMASDTRKYYMGCLQCAKNGATKPKAPSLPTTIHKPLQIIVADFVGPFFKSEEGNEHILNLVDYFSRFCWCLTAKSTGATEVIENLKLWVNTVPVSFYSDPGSGFISRRLHDFLQTQGIGWVNAPSGSHKSVGLVKVHNKILQQILTKLSNPRDRE